MANMVTTLVILASLYWDAPTTRTSGAAMPQSEIDHYTIYLDGEYYTDTPATEHNVDVSGTYCVTVTDIWGYSSECSNSEYVDINFKGNPSAPGSLRRKK